MANPWSIPAIGWTVIVVGWLVSPIISLAINKLVDRFIFDTSEELRVLKDDTVPDLEATLKDVEEKRISMMWPAGDEVPRSDLFRIDNMYMNLKSSALGVADDILDLVDYRQIEKKVTGGDGGSWSVQQLLHAAGSSIVAAVCRGSWIQRCIGITPAPLLQLVQRMKHKVGKLFGGIISLWSSGANLLPVSQETSTAGVQRMCGWCRQLVANTTSCCRAVLGWSTHRIADARYYRDWSYEQIGITSNQQKDDNVPITERIRVKKQINEIAAILNSTKKSDLLNKNSSSTAKVDSDKESSRRQKEIDKLYGSIEQEVFGRDNDRQNISRKLREEPGTNAASSSATKPYSVIGIYGIAGSGKTTLAQFVCKYEKGTGYFNPIMFIRVRKTFSLDDIFSDMLEEITQSRPSKDKDLSSLNAELKMEKLKDKCFLLVLDDMWVNGDNKKEQEQRGILLDVLGAGKSGSRILVTSQTKDAAAALGAQEQMNIPIPDLEEEQYLSMFMHYALDVSQVSSSDYERYKAIGERITKKLCSSPIAAITVAAQLRRNLNIDFWETTGKLDVLNKTMGALSWSYKQLNVDIRRCFTSCSIFPKGYQLERDQLVLIWIAQGYVKPGSNATEDLEALGQRYFDQLLTFSFIQVRRRTGLFGEEEVEFTIHDLLHDLAVRVSGSEFWSIDLKNCSTKETPPGVRHLFIESDDLAEIAEKVLDMGNLRTLIIVFEMRYMDEVSWETFERNRDLEKILDRLFMRLTQLRVLILDQFRDSFRQPFREVSVPASIDQMKHLRYLGFAGHHEGQVHLILPNTFSKLYHMQIIDIPCRQASVPDDMVNLIYLRHYSAPLSFPNIGRLTSLQTLRTFVRKLEPGYGLKELMHLNQLRGSLMIEDIGNVRSKEEALDAHLMHKEGLRNLVLRFDGSEAQHRKLNVDPDVEAEVLEGLCPPKDLQELHIGDYRGSRYPSWMLSRHHPDAPTKQLHRLELYFCSQLASIPEGSELFAALRELCIAICDWDSLPENMERLLSLQRLEIWSCKKMERLPTLPQALKNIHISGCGMLSSIDISGCDMLTSIDINNCDMLRSIDIMECPSRPEFKWEKEKRLEVCMSLEYCEDTAPTATGSPEKSVYPVIRCPCLVTLRISDCANLVTLPNLPPSLKSLSIRKCEELCSVSGQLGQLEKLRIYKCNKLQSIDSLGEVSSLATLLLSCCQCLASLGSGGGPGSYMALQELQIEYCPAMDMDQFNKNVLDGLVQKEISHALSSNPDKSVFHWF